MLAFLADGDALIEHFRIVSRKEFRRACVGRPGDLLLRRAGSPDKSQNGENCDASHGFAPSLEIQDTKFRPVDAPDSRAAALPSGPIPGRNPFKASAQFGVALPHLITKFLPLKARERRLPKVAPGDPEPLLQRMYILVQSVGHRPQPSKYSADSLRDSRARHPWQALQVGRVRNEFSTSGAYFGPMGIRPGNVQGKGPRAVRRRDDLLGVWLELLKKLDNPVRRRATKFRQTQRLRRNLSTRSFPAQEPCPAGGRPAHGQRSSRR